MRTSLGLEGSLLLVMVFGSAALTFFVPRPRLLWASLLAAVCGFGDGRLGDGWNAMFDTTAEAWPLLLAPVVFGAGFAWRPHWRQRMAAGLLGVPYGIAVVAALLADRELPGCAKHVAVSSTSVSMRSETHRARSGSPIEALAVPT